MEACGIRALGEVLETLGLGQVQARRGFAHRPPRPQHKEGPLDGGPPTLTRCRERSIRLQNVRHAGADGRSSAENAEGAVNVLDEHDVELAGVRAKPCTKPTRQRCVGGRQPLRKVRKAQHLHSGRLSGSITRDTRVRIQQVRCRDSHVVPGFEHPFHRRQQRGQNASAEPARRRIPRNTHEQAHPE